MIENEFKIMLSKEQYDAIHTFYSWDTEVEQVNWYYDSESGELSGRHITCRVRTLGGRFYLQVKLPAHENSSGAVSRIELGAATSIRIHIRSGAFRIQRRGWTSRCKAALGSLSTYRSVKRFDGAEIDLDKSEYFGRTDSSLKSVHRRSVGAGCHF
ncbi:MAG: CYTH domain-containing protein [Oscillospiraceae bacterium]